MPFADRVLLWLHIAFVMFAIGPATAAIMSTPRYIRARNLAVTAYLYRITRIFSAASLGVFLFGIILASTEHKISRPWVSASMTLFVVAAVLLVLIMRDQHKAIDALRIATAEDAGEVAPSAAAAAERTAVEGTGRPALAGQASGSGQAGQSGSAAGAPGSAPAPPGTAAGPAPEPAADSAPGDTVPASSPADGDAVGRAATASTAGAAHIAAVERGRIASMGGVVSIIWLVILVLMVWSS
jgi:hypothetical protein